MRAIKWYEILIMLALAAAIDVAVCFKAVQYFSTKTYRCEL